VTPDPYWPSPWPAEDGGARRLQRAAGSALGAGPLVATFREALVTTMVVLRSPDEVLALRHTPGPDAVAWVERIDPITLAPILRSDDLPAGPVWPGGLAAHADGAIHTVFGRHAHRLGADLRVESTCELPVDRPYNSFVVLKDGHLVTKEFGGVLPGEDPASAGHRTTGVIVLDPVSLRVVATATLPEASIARLSCDGDTIIVVGTESVFAVHWDGTALDATQPPLARYRTLEGQTYGWDPVIALGAVWFLDNGFGSERYTGTFRGAGTHTTPMHIVRVDLATREVGYTEVCGLPGSVVANPPLVDVERRIVVGFDSGNGVLAAFDIDASGRLAQRWRHEQNHGAHLCLLDGGALISADHDASRMMDQLVVRDISTGEERGRVDTGSAFQSVLFSSPGWHEDLYYCSFLGISRISGAG